MADPNPTEGSGRVRIDAGQLAHHARRAGGHLAERHAHARRQAAEHHQARHGHPGAEAPVQAPETAP